MENNSILDSEYKKVIEENPTKKFVLYLRTHTDDEKENELKIKLVRLFGECKELPGERLVIFIVNGDKVKEFIDILNSQNTQMHLSFIQKEDELINIKNKL